MYELMVKGFKVGQIGMYAVVGALVLAPRIAGAVDPKSYAGAECQRASGGATAYDSAGRIRNASAGVATVVCPIVRDDLSAGNPAWVAANMTVIDNNPLAGFSCTAQSRSMSGAAVFFSNASTTPAFVGTATIGFAAVAKQAGGYYVISCNVPALSAVGASSLIASYRVTEPFPAEP